MSLLGKEENKNAECWLKRKCMKSMQGFNIPLKNSVDNMQRKLFF